MREILLLLVVWGMMGCNFASSNLNSTGAEKCNDGDYTGAIEVFNKAITLNPKNAMAHYNRGLAKYFLKEYKDAITDYNEATNIDPYFALAYYNRGISKGELKDYDGAIFDYTKAINLNPDFGLAYYNRGRLKINFKDYQEAITDLTEAIKISRHDTNSHRYLSISYSGRALAKYYLNEYDAALADIELALIVDRNNVRALQNRGIMEYEQNHFEQATEDFNKVLKINTQYYGAYYYLGMIDIKNGYKDIGGNEIRKAASMGLEGGADSVKKYCH